MKENNQVDYKETPYEVTKWDIIGEYEESPSFIPMELNIIDESKLVVDPLFADYGGTNIGETKRLHLEEEKAFDIEKYSKPEEKKENIEEIKKELQAEYEAEIGKIKEEYFQKGKEEAEKTFEEEKANFKLKEDEDLKNTIQSLHSEITKYKEDLEREALTLSLKVAGKILEKEVSENQDYILNIISKAIQSMPKAIIKNIRVSHASYEFLKDINLKEMFKDAQGAFEIVEDETLDKGCIVETMGGDMNFNLDEALKRISDELTR